MPIKTIIKGKSYLHKVMLEKRFSHQVKMLSNKQTRSPSRRLASAKHRLDDATLKINE
jgi:hypothetical protein